MYHVSTLHDRLEFSLAGSQLLSIVTMAINLDEILDEHLPPS
jgi:hypothetical protein